MAGVMPVRRLGGSCCWVAGLASGDVFADAAGPVAVTLACVWGGDRFGEVAQVFAGVGGSAAIALVCSRRWWR